MKFNWSVLFSGVKRLRSGNRLTQLIVFLVFALVIAQACTLYFGLPKDQASLFLHYTVYFGVDSTGTIWDTAWIPGIGLGTALLNMILAYTTREYRMRVTVLALTAVCELFLLIAAILLVIINRSV